ncbi:substrate-binding domain-containing protein [Domibacillus sp. A3M-37]|uniref:substrate-binding domain-containing protein n=1 Tax=Domibacillus sp. A3M-37 TaxID=2962037 RepID=UPI0035C0446A
MRRFLSTNPEQRPSVIFATNDIPALLMIDAALDLGLNVPDDSAVVGIDDLFFGTLCKYCLKSILIKMASRFLIGWP